MGGRDGDMWQGHRQEMEVGGGRRARPSVLSALLLVFLCSHSLRPSSRSLSHFLFFDPSLPNT